MSRSSWGGYEIRDIYQKMEEVAKAALTKPKTVHIALMGEGKCFCGSKTEREAVHFVRTDTGWRGGEVPPHLPLASALKLRPIKPITLAGKPKISVCLKCIAGLKKKGDELAADALKAQQATSTVTLRLTCDEFKDRGGRDGMLPPPRPVGTEGMTGHLDDGSKAGVCETSAAGFRTTFLPWIQCANCLVQYDQFVEEGLMYTRGLYAEAVK